MLAREPLSEQLAHGVLDLIRETGLQPGQALPPVKTLASRFGVTVPTIREALRGLQTTQSVTIRHGSGIYVGPGISLSLIPNPNGAPLTEARALELIEARLTVEPDIAAMAASRRTDRDLVALRQSCSNAKEDHAETVKRSFHKDLARASGNFVLSEILDAMLHVYSHEQQAVRLLIENKEREHQRHMQILSAVANRDVNDARESTRVHLEEILAEANRKFH